MWTCNAGEYCLNVDSKLPVCGARRVRASCSRRNAFASLLCGRTRVSALYLRSNIYCLPIYSETCCCCCRYFFACLICSRQRTSPSTRTIYEGVLFLNRSALLAFSSSECPSRMLSVTRHTQQFHDSSMMKKSMRSDGRWHELLLVQCRRTERLRPLCYNDHHRRLQRHRRRRVGGDGGHVN